MGSLIGVMTERALAHRYIRESRKTSTLVDAPTTVAKIVEVLDGELIAGEDKMIEGRVWVHSIDAQRSQSSISPGDVVVVGNRDDAQRQALELGAALLVASNGMRPEPEILELAEKQRRQRRRQPTRQLRVEPHDHAGRALPRPRGYRAPDRRS